MEGHQKLHDACSPLYLPLERHYFVFIWMNKSANRPPLVLSSLTSPIQISTIPTYTILLPSQDRSYFKIKFRKNWYGIQIWVILIFCYRITLCLDSDAYDWLNSFLNIFFNLREMTYLAALRPWDMCQNHVSWAPCNHLCILGQTRPKMSRLLQGS